VIYILPKKRTVILFSHAELTAATEIVDPVT
jgi:hypothetical protein